MVEQIIDTDNKDFCLCGCGQEIVCKYDDYIPNYIWGHHWRGKKRDNPRNFEKNPAWKGGKVIQNGYVQILIKNHPIRSYGRGYVPEHVLNMEEFLTESIGIKVYLSGKFIVHHKDENRQNNDINNLELTTRNKHPIIHKSYLNKKKSCKNLKLTDS